MSISKRLDESDSEYASVVAKLFRLLELDAHVQEDVAGARATYRVDVAVRPGNAGVHRLWIVDCKKWRRPVSKEKVEALAKILEDVGADRGFIFCEAGVQPGVCDAARLANITLTSVEQFGQGESESLRETTYQRICAAYQSALANLHGHHGYAKHLRIQAFRSALLGVFEPNWHDLLTLLGEVANGRLMPEVFHEGVFGEKWPVPVSERVTSRVVRHLHNYVASSATIVDHVRRIDLTDSQSLLLEYEQRKLQLLASREVQFVRQLRNFSLHRSLPLIGYEDGVQLSATDLLAWDRWSSDLINFIRSYVEFIPLRPIVKRHHDLVYALNVWLLGELQLESRAALAETRDLIAACNEAEAYYREFPCLLPPWVLPPSKSGGTPHSADIP